MPTSVAFGPATRAWFDTSFADPTPAQIQAWAAIATGSNTLVVAPTGSGKTLAAFLSALDRLVTPQDGADGRVPKSTTVLYVSPLKALAVDVERNLRAPLTGIAQASHRLGLPEPRVTVGIRSGDTPPQQRRALVSHPPDILITTPESLFLMLTSAARQTLTGVGTVILDEIHAVAGTKRGAHLALSLERLDALLPQPAQRIGLSATVRPAETVAAFLGGGRPVTIVAPRVDKQVDISIVVPVPDLAELDAAPATDAGTTAPVLGDDDLVQISAGKRERPSIWPHVEERIVDLVEQHRSTLVFCNSRRLAERLTARLNEIAAARAAGPEDPDYAPVDPQEVQPAQVMAQSGAAIGSPPLLAKAHHGSVSKEQRALIEDDLKAGRLPCVVATSSLELGIDMGAIDLVIQVEPPPSVASGLQRIGRAGHQVGEISRGVLFPKARTDLLPAVVTATRMATGSIEELHVPTNPLDVLAQQIIAAVADRTWQVEELFELVRRAMPFATLPRSAFDAVLDMLAGRYPSDEFAQLRPRLVWDRVSGTLSGRPGAQRLAVTSGGTIPDRGLFGVFIAGEASGARVGELDEEMVYESRVGDVFALGATSWRIEAITHDRVLVTPAPGQPGRLPFWKGDSISRPAELGIALGAYARTLSARTDTDARAQLTEAGLDTWATDNLLAYLAEQRLATGRLPDDRTLIVERFRDELGDHRICLLSPYGQAVHAPWSLAVQARLRERLGVEVNAMSTNDGIVLRIPETDADPPGAEAFLFEPDEIEDLVTAEVGGSALFAARFRECAARALLLPRRDPGKRTPLWQQRLRSSQLLQVTARYGSFPIVLETVREVLQDVYDLPALTGLLGRLRDRSVRVLDVVTERPSPYAAALSFGYVAGFLYEGDAPLAERRAAALALDPGLLAELLGRTQLRELLEEEVLVQVGAELQRLTAERRARGVEGVVDLLRDLGPMSGADLALRVDDPDDLHDRLEHLVASHRLIEVRLGGESRFAVIEDASRLRDAFGVPFPPGLPSTLQESVADPLGDLVSRFARTHVPFVTGDLAEHFGVGTAVVLPALHRLAQQQRADHGEFTPGRTGEEWCDTGVLRLLRRRSLATLRQQVEPVEQDTLGRFLPAWQHVDRPLSGVDGVLQTIEQLAGLAQPAAAWESLVLPSRVRNYTPAMLDELTAAGEVIWSGAGALPGQAAGWVALHPADTAPLTLAMPGVAAAGADGPDGSDGDRADAAAAPLGDSWLTDRVLEVLGSGGGFFFRQLADAVSAGAPAPVYDADLVTAIWDLVWAGRVTGDTIVGLRALLSGGANRPPALRRAPRGRVAGGRGSVRTRLPSRSGPPAVSGRWSLLPKPEVDPTRRGHAQAELLLDRYGVVSRGVVEAEGISGGFAAVYKVLAAFEQSGRALRGYYVAGLGAAQFGAPGAVDRLRADADRTRAGSRALVLAATDPANPYGAALGWPTGTGSTGHRPGRKPGALVALVDGSLVLYLESGGRTLLSFADDPDVLAAAAAGVAEAVRRGALGRLAVEKADGVGVHDSPVAQALSAAGFTITPRGLRLRG